MIGPLLLLVAFVIVFSLLFISHLWIDEKVTLPRIFVLVGLFSIVSILVMAGLAAIAKLIM